MIVSEATWEQNDFGTLSEHGTWQWAGSNDDISYTDIGATFTLGVTAPQQIPTLNANVTSYRYYRMTQMTGTTKQHPFIQQIGFYIGVHP